MAHKRVPGIPTAINGKVYLVPAITLRQNLDHSPIVEKLLRGDWACDPRAFFENGMPIVLMAIQRNYPEITRADLDEGLDMTTFRIALMVALGRSGKELEPPPEDREEYMAIKAKLKHTLSSRRSED